MAPLNQVILLEQHHPQLITNETDSSGPFSMIFGIESNEPVKDATVIIESKKSGLDSSPKLVRSRTFEKIDASPEKDSVRPQCDTTNLKRNATFTTTSSPTKQAQQALQALPMMVPKDPNAAITLNTTLVDANESFDVCKADGDKSCELSEVANQPAAKAANITKSRHSFVLDLPNIYQDYKTTSSPLNDGVPRKFRLSPSHLDDDSNKRDSLELEESLGILTPDQMIHDMAASRTPSSENIRLPYDNESSAVVSNYSLGLIDGALINRHLGSCIRLEQTPSPEELPLDPTPIIQDTKDKKPLNSFITSITSITSLDTGYQGDGEMSRPASRGADNSPLTRRPQPRQPPRRADPMTDSDFYTESDADNLEEHPLRGDRKAQVIDGTLYGVDAQATADLYANNRENMDSSGIFTDIERTEDTSSADNDVHEVASNPVELSPSDSSTQTISDDSQTNAKMIIEKTLTPQKPLQERSQCDPDIVSNASTIVSSPGSNRSFRSDDNNKFKMPKRNVASKVKAMLEPSNKENEKRTIATKKTSPGRWDAVMNKISVPEGRKGFKEVKSKVFSTLNTNVQRNEKKGSAQDKATSNVRRVRNQLTNSAPKQTGSISSSLSDVSGASRKKLAGAAKKQREVLKVNHVLHGTKIQSKTGPIEARNNSKNLLGSKEVKDKKREKAPLKDTGRTTIKNNSVSAAARPPPSLPQRPIVKQPPLPRTSEALAVLVQHLVFNLEAFNNPYLRKDAEKARAETEEARRSYKLLEESLNEEKVHHLAAIQEERDKFHTQITQLIEKHQDEINDLHVKQQELQKRANIEKCSLLKCHEELQKKHNELVDILREENDAIRDSIDEKNDKIKCLEHNHEESLRLQHDLAAKLKEAHEEIARLKEENEALFNARSNGDTSFQEVQSLRAVLDLKQTEFADLRKCLAEASHKADQLPAAEEKIAVLAAKCEDLQHQLERKQESEMGLYSENKKLQESFAEEVKQKKRLAQHNEELQWRLQQNKEVFKVLEGADQNFTRSLITSSFNERHSVGKHPNFERTLSFRERKLSSISNTSRKSRSSIEADLDDISPPSSPKVKGVVEKSDSVSYVLEMDESPEVVASRIVRRSFRNATPPKNNTPTKSPANKRPRKNSLMQSSSAASILSTKDDVVRPDSSATNRTDEEEFYHWSRQMHVSTPNCKDRLTVSAYSNGDYEEEDIEDFKLPALPSEIGRKHGNTLPVPKHLAGEAMISESASEDESSTSSSSSEQL